MTTMLDATSHLPAPVLYVLGSLVVGLHVFHLSTRRSPWPGAVVPGLWLVVLTVLIAGGQVDHWWRAAFVTLGLFVVWGRGRTRAPSPTGSER